MQKTFDSATQALSTVLDLTLVYLVAIDIADPSQPLTIISSHGPLNPAPELDPGLHLQALRAPEGGLIYQSSSGETSFTSGLLVPVLELKTVGYVLAGFSLDKRLFTDRDMSSCTQFARLQEQWVARIGKE
ncbi:hypothetical protein RQP46_005913 [Phenoliferia psychrophenolica]